MNKAAWCLALAVLVSACADTMLVSDIRCSMDSDISYDYRGGPAPASLKASHLHCDPYREDSAQLP